MADHHECEFCANPENGMIRSTPCSRREALSLYLGLQRSGFLPTMCENEAGLCRVCYSEQQRSGG